MYSIYILKNGRWLKARRPVPNLFYSKKDAEKAVEQWTEGYFANYSWKIDYYILKVKR